MSKQKLTEEAAAHWFDFAGTKRAVILDGFRGRHKATAYFPLSPDDHVTIAANDESFSIQVNLSLGIMRCVEADDKEIPTFYYS